MSTANLKPDYNFKYFLELLQSVLNGTPAPSCTVPVDWQIIYDISVDHSLAGILWAAIEKLPEAARPQGGFMPYLKQMYQEQLVADLNRTFETERLINLLSKEGVAIMPFKGVVTKADYPQPHLRSMTDVDLLCREEFRPKAEQIFLHEGYVRESVSIKDSAFRKDEILYFELHSNLLTEDSPAYDYFNTVWDRAKVNKASGHVEMTLEDTYLYMLEHLAKHIESGGAGIRFYMDVYVFMKAHDKELDRAYIDKVLTKIKLSQFEKVTLEICENWFSGKEKVNVNTPNAAFILNSCTFGRTKVAFLADTVINHKGKNSAANGITRIIKKLFPAVRWMRLRYKAVNKLPVLYPVFVPVFWVERLFISRNVNTSNLGRYFASEQSEGAEEIRKTFVSLGLGKRI